MTPVLWLAPSLYQPRGRQVAVTWSRLAERISNPRAAQAKELLARWAPVEFRDGYRCMANVRRAHAVVLDVDDGSPLETTARALVGHFTLVHSTFSATEARPRWRVIVPLDRPVDADVYARAWRWLAMWLEAAGARPDYAARDASHAWAVPARPPSGFYVSRVVHGPLASVAAALEAIPKPRPIELLPTRHHHGGDTYERRLERARLYLERMPGAISGSQGHATTFRAAVAMVRGFALDPDDALHLLVDEFNPRCAPPWSLAELKHKVKSAATRARVELGWLADRPLRRSA